MKGLVVLLALVALVAGGAIPVVPKDNRHFVEGESHYLWEANGNGNPIPVDLHEPLDEDAERSVYDIQYWLFTRNNPTTPQVITFGDVSSIWSSNYLSTRPLNVIAHEYAGDGNSEVNTMLTSAWLSVMDANVIVVDWRRLASGSYVTAVNETPAAGRAVASFVTWLINTGGGNWNNVHFAGFGLGGQIIGNAGRATGGRPRRVTGLNPMNTLWYDNPNRIGEDAGQYVEIIHTEYTLDNSSKIGHVDFYPNGGTDQPGCYTELCSHIRSYELFASSIRTNHLSGRRCINVQQAQSDGCFELPRLNLGNAILTKQGVGFFGLSTGYRWPF